MVVNLNGIAFGQIYGDNSGGAEFDSDGDGTPTQEDEFVSVTNTTGAPIDISGWEIWSEPANGSGSPDSAQAGLYHTFPPGTTLAAGETLYVINEITGTVPGWAQEATVGGLESGSGAPVTNFLSEGNGGDSTESIGLVDPVSGDYIVFNASPLASELTSLPGFTGTNKIGEEDGNSVQADQNAGSSYQYNSGTDSYDYSAVFVPCFTKGTRIRTPKGDVLVERLKVGQLICTLDHGPQPIRNILVRNIDFAGTKNDSDRPILIAAGSMGNGLPSSNLIVSPQHRMLVNLPSGEEVLTPAKSLVHRPGIRVMRGMKSIQYIHLIFDQHEIVFGNDSPSESFFEGPFALSNLEKTELSSSRQRRVTKRPARPVLKVQEAFNLL